MNHPKSMFQLSGVHYKPLPASGEVQQPTCLGIPDEDVAAVRALSALPESGFGV